MPGWVGPHHPSCRRMRVAHSLDAASAHPCAPRRRRFAGLTLSRRRRAFRLLPQHTWSNHATSAACEVLGRVIDTDGRASRCSPPSGLLRSPLFRLTGLARQTLGIPRESNQDSMVSKRLEKDRSPSKTAHQGGRFSRIPESPIRECHAAPYLQSEASATKPALTGFSSM